MDFESAMYNCLLRRMELVAFDENIEYNDYWKNSFFYQRAMGLGLKL
jgi:hypothetical protein